MEVRFLASVGRSGRREGGFTFIELLVSLGISSVIFGTMMLQYSTLVTQTRDHQIRLETLVQAQAIVQSMAAEIRLAGNGVPFDQANFAIGNLSLSDPSIVHPIVIADSNASRISFRLNEGGDVALLTSDFNPAGSLVVALTDVSQFQVNDPLFISNGVVSGDDGLFGTVAAVNTLSKTITLASGFVAPAGATFAMGSILEEVPVITYQASSDGVDITRDSGFGPVILGRNSDVTFEYLDQAGTVLALPLTEGMLVNNLRMVRITVSTESLRPLSTGEPHIVTVSQRVGIRNLNLLY